MSATTRVRIWRTETAFRAWTMQELADQLQLDVDVVERKIDEDPEGFAREWMRESEFPAARSIDYTIKTGG